MADSKLSALDPLAAEPADTDEIYVNDGGTSKRITYGTLKAALLARANHTGTQTVSTISDFAAEVAANAAVAANTAKTTNATHTGQVTGASTLTLDASAVSDQSLVTVASGDFLLVLDVSTSPNTLKKIVASDFATAAQGALAASATQPGDNISDLTNDSGFLSSVEGTAVLSTGEVGAVKFLREDGDGTCSWQVPAGAGDLKADGTVPLTANWDVGAFTITGTQFISDIATGTPPFVVSSTTEVANLKAATATLADTVTTNANLTGHVTSVGNAAVLGSFTVAQLSAALSDASISGNNTGDQTSIAGITGTKAQFDTAVTDGNFLYVGDVTTNATHTGDVTGSGALTVDPSAISGKATVTADGADFVLVLDSSDSPNALKKSLVSDFKWTIQFKSAAYTALDGDEVWADSSGSPGVFTITLPATPSTGDRVRVKDSGGAAGTNNITVGRNGETIAGAAADFVIDQHYGQCGFAYDGTTWQITPVGGT